MKNVLTWLGRLLLAGTFGYAAVLKLVDPAAFATAIDHYRLLPHPLTLATAVYLPWLELVCAGAVLFRWRERGALTLLLALSFAFSLALASAWGRGLDITCGCFGTGAESTPPAVPVVRALGLAAVSVLLLRRNAIKS